jgi:hypothetical protein|tara:strand:+ start:586 stop:930 length:345 start_codon:yes stop_codon:yes gene_type:complete
MIVNTGKNDIATNYIASNYTVVKIGNGGDDTAASQTDLDAFITGSNKTVTPSIIGSELVWTVSYTGAEIGNQGVSELGIFHATSDKLLSRVTFTNTGIVANADTLTLTVRLEVK